MTGTNFDRALEYVLANEGGYSNHASDSGGATKFGITLASLERWRGVECTPVEVEALTLAEAGAIYYEWYWRALSLDSIPDRPAVQTTLLDAGVVFGVPTAARRAQQTLWHADPRVKIDGVMGPMTFAALKLLTDKTFIAGFQAQLRERVNAVILSFPKNEVFRKGWERRIIRYSTLT